MLRFNSAWDVFRGAGRLYQGALCAVGCDVHPSAIVLAAAPVEVHLQTVGARVLLDFEARVVPHFITGRAFFFRAVRVEEGVWVQGPCCVLNPVRVGAGARILPATTSMPNEVRATSSLFCRPLMAHGTHGTRILLLLTSSRLSHPIRSGLAALPPLSARR